MSQNQKRFPLSPWGANELGFNTHDPDVPDRLNGIAAAGGKWARINVSFWHLAHLEEQGREVYYYWDRYVARAEELGLRLCVLFSDIDVERMMTAEQRVTLEALEKTNRWQHRYTSRFAPEGEGRKLWMDRVNEMSTRYEKRGIIWQPWNEGTWWANFIMAPDCFTHVDVPQSEAKIEAYVQHCRDCHDAIPSGEWFGINSTGPHYDLEWWTATALKGILEFTDIVMPHGYVRSFYHKQPNQDDGPLDLATAGFAGVQEIVSNLKPKNRTVAFGIGEWGIAKWAAGSGPPSEIVPPPASELATDDATDPVPILDPRLERYKQMKLAGDRVQSRMTFVYNFGASDPRWRVPEGDFWSWWK